MEETLTLKLRRGCRSAIECDMGSSEETKEVMDFSCLLDMPQPWLGHRDHSWERARELDGCAWAG